MDNIKAFIAITAITTTMVIIAITKVFAVIVKVITTMGIVLRLFNLLLLLNR